MPPTRIGDATVAVAIEPDGLARVEFAAQYRVEPRHPADFVLRGVNLRSVECESSSAEEPAIVSFRGIGAWRPGLALIVVRATQTDELLTIKIRYTLRLGPFFPKFALGFQFNSSHFPYLRRATPRLPPESSPFVAIPDTLVRVRVPPGFAVLGPQHITAPQPIDGSEHLFSAYEGRTPFHLIVGRFSPLVTQGPIAVLAADPSAVAPDLRDMIVQRADAVRSHFETLLGPAAVEHRSVLLFSHPGVPSTCLGSSILLNTSGLGDEARRLTYVTETLAHEYAHTWWEYSVIWSPADPESRRSEAFAIGLARDCVETLGDTAALQQLRDFDWDYAMSALRAPRRVLKRSKTWAGQSAGCLLSEMLRTRRPEATAALKALWAEARRAPVSRPSMLATLSRMVSPAVAEAFSHALTHPVPVPVHARIVLVAPADWALELGARRADARVLAERLRAVRVNAELANDGRALRIALADPAKAAEVTYMLEPAHLVTKRTARGLGLGFTRIAWRLWKWSAPSRLAGKPQSIVAWLRDSLWGLIAVMVQPESPAGWQVLARLCRPLASKLADWLEIAAGRRATYYGEEALIARMAELLQNVSGANATRASG